MLQVIFMMISLLGMHAELPLMASDANACLFIHRLLLALLGCSGHLAVMPMLQLEGTLLAAFLGSIHPWEVLALLVGHAGGAVLGTQCAKWIVLTRGELSWLRCK